MRENAFSRLLLLTRRKYMRESVLEMGKSDLSGLRFITFWYVRPRDSPGFSFLPSLLFFFAPQKRFPESDPGNSRVFWTPRAENKHLFLGKDIPVVETHRMRTTGLAIELNSWVNIYKLRRGFHSGRDGDAKRKNVILKEIIPQNLVSFEGNPRASRLA